MVMFADDAWNERVKDCLKGVLRRKEVLVRAAIFQKLGAGSS